MSDYSVAFDSFMPTYLEITQKYPKYSFDEVIVSAEDYPHVSKHLVRIRELFFGEYCDRYINRETLEMWFVKLQHEVNKILPEFEQAYGLYEKHVDGNVNVLDEVSMTSRVFSKGGNPTSFNETPEVSIDSYVTNADQTEQTSVTRNNQNVIDQVNDNIVKWKNLDCEFVRRFENCFMKVMW